MFWHHSRGILAGGLSRRMGGGDKALRKLGGVSLLARVITALRPQCAGLLLSVNGDPARFAGFDFPVIAVERNAVIACARSGGQTHPLIALWPVAIRQDLHHALIEKDMRKAEDFLQNYRRAIVEWPVESFDPFFNVNETGDLKEAETILSRRETHVA